MIQPKVVWVVTVGMVRSDRIWIYLKTESIEFVDGLDTGHKNQ